MRALPLVLAFGLVLAAATALAQSGPDGSGAAPADGSGVAAPDGSGEAPAPSGTAEVTALPESAPGVGEPFAVALRVSTDLDATITGVRVHENPYIEVLEAAAGDDGTWTATLVAWRPGDHPVQLAADLLSTAGVPGDALADPVTIPIRSVIANESDPAPAASDEPTDVRVPDLRPVYAGGALGIALLGLLVGRLVRRSGEAEVGPPPPPPRPAWEVAFERLDALESDGWLERGEHLRFHELLSEIVREYLGRRLGFHGPESTTPEVRAVLAAQRDAVGAMVPMILTLLAETDLVKFARVSPPAEHSRQLLDDARALVEQMSAREIEAASGEVDDVPAPIEDDVPPPVPGGES